MTTTTKTATTGADTGVRDHTFRPAFISDTVTVTCADCGDVAGRHPHRFTDERPVNGLCDICGTSVQFCKGGGEQPSDPAELSQSDDWNVQAIDDDYDGIYNHHGVLVAKVLINNYNNNAARILRCVNSHATLIAALEQARTWLTQVVDGAHGDYNVVDASDAEPIRDSIDEALRQARGGE